MTKLLLTGATGLVGGEVLDLALGDARVTGVLAIGRRATGRAHPKLSERVLADFAEVGALGAGLRGVGLTVHCLAAYNHRVGRTEYERITVGYLDALIRTLEAASPEAAFCLFSSGGAARSGRSPVAALNAKGRAEKRLMAAAFPRRYVFRPGYIRPGRPRPRPLFYDPLVAPIFRLFPWFGVDSADLARAMLETGLEDPRPAAVFENGDIRRLAGRA